MWATKSDKKDWTSQTDYNVITCTVGIWIN